MINFDLLVAGCDTRCKHCYVNGGPLPRMKVDDAVLCIERLDAIAANLPDEAYFTLDHEPMGHPTSDESSARRRAKSISGTIITV